MPRNRKCGNCRHFEIAPLWRKGWCRNPQLYPVHANHLVDSTSLDCEGGFRSRIYWEPLPEGSGKQVQAPPVLSFEEQKAAKSPPVIPIGAAFKPKEYSPEEDSEAQLLPELTRLPEPRDETGWRAEVRQRLPFTENWPLEKFEPLHILLWGAAGLFILIALIVLMTSGSKKAEVAPTLAPAMAAIATQNALNTLQASAGNTPAANQASLTPTVTASILGKTGKVMGLAGGSLNVRQDAGINAKVIARLTEGDRVRLLDGPKDADGQKWYQVEVGGQTGWVSQKFIQIE